MKLNVLTRKIHYWLAILLALPALVMIGTGLLLQLKKQVAWVQPPERRGAGKEPLLSMAQLLEACRRVPQAQVRGWGDIHRVDLRPSKGVFKVTAENHWEVQVDARTGEVLQVAYRRSDLLEAMHDGSWFHEWAKLGLFLPAGIMLLLSLLTGLYLFFLPIVWRGRRRFAPAAVASGEIRRARPRKRG